MCEDSDIDLDTTTVEIFFYLADSESPEMEYGRRQQDLCPSSHYPLVEMFRHRK